MTPLSEAAVEENRLARKKNRTRQALLDTALALFAKKGIYSPSIEEITEGADLGKGTFYKYFASREELIAALVRQGFDLLIGRVTQTVSDETGEGRILGRILDAHGAFFRERPEYLLLFHQARGWLKLPGEAKSPIRQEFERYLARMREAIPAHRGGRAILPEKRTRMARTLAGFISGALSFQYILAHRFESAPDLMGDLVLLTEMMGL